MRVGGSVKAFARASLVDAAVILAFGTILNYVIPRLMAAGYGSANAINLVPPFFDTLPVYTVVAALLAILGKVLGSLGSVMSAGSATIVAGSVSGYVQGVAEEAEEMGTRGWPALLAGSAAAVLASLLLSALL